MTKKTVRLGADTPVDLPKLIDTRLLIQANSGGGKSYAIRRLLEQTHGHVQQIVIDLEGEFATLREKYDYVLAAAKGGETVTHPRHAKLLAERLLELGVSAILDIYELKAHERISFVQLFLEAMIDAPKKLWHPVLVIVDEAHVFCPEQGKAESAAAVIDLATRGRKRGYCAVLATQRISKLRKDAAAECNNVLIGRTGLDIDIKRAADVLGFKKDREVELRRLEPGHFFGFGPALSAEVRDVHIGPVVTTHPKAGSRIAFTPPPPTAAVRALLPQLADLPAEAEERAKTIEEARKQIAQLKRENTQLQKGAPAAPAVVKEKTVEKRVEVAVLKEGQLKRAESIITRHHEAVRENLAAEQELERIRRDRWVESQQKVFEAIHELTTAIAKVSGNGQRPLPIPPPPPRGMTVAQVMNQGIQRHAPLPDSRARNRKPVPVDGEFRLRAGARRMLEALARRHPVPTTAAQMGQLAGIATSGGTFSTYLSDLRTAGYLVDVRDGLEITDAGWAAIGQEPGSLTAHNTEEMLQMYAGVLRGGARRMIDVLVELHPNRLTREELGQRANVSTTGGTFSTYLSDLNKAGLVDVGREDVAASELLMDPASAAR